MAKTVTDAAIEWKDGFSLKKVKGTEIKLKFELRESKIYSFSFRKQGNLPDFVGTRRAYRPAAKRDVALLMHS